MKYLLFNLIIFFLAACNNNSSYKKIEKGYEYMIISNGNGLQPVYGNYIQYHIKTGYKNEKVDTIFEDSREYMAQTVSFDSMKVPLHFLNILNHAGIGDSIIIRISKDSAIANAIRLPGVLPDGGHMYTTIKLINVFTNADLADSAKRAELKINGLRIFNMLMKKKEVEIKKNNKQLENDTSIIKSYLNKKNISYIKGNWGSYVVIQEPGTGKLIEYNDVVGVKYTGKTLDSNKVFDSNIDPKFGNPEFFEVTMGAVNVLAGWTDALLKLKNGAKATVYIPSSLAFGKKGFQPWIKPNDNVFYEMEIKNVITEDSALQIVSKNRRDKEMQKKR